jgi:proline iminopeptidase
MNFVDGLYCRVVGAGRPIVVLHGGPSLDHYYLLPEMDRLAASFRLVYYDQRGRGRSAEGVEADDVTIASEVADLDAVRRHFGYDSVALLGHSWGAVLALEYATRHPAHVSQLVLVNAAPASADDYRAFCDNLLRIRPQGDAERMQAIAAGAPYGAGNLEAEVDYYTLHFRVAIRDPERVEQVVRRLRAHFTEQGVLTARAIGQRLYDETWGSDTYDVVPRLQALDIPTLVLHGDHDFIPVAVAARIAEGIPLARFVVLEDCGHFAYLEASDAFCEHVAALFGEGTGTWMGTPGHS